MGFWGLRLSPLLLWLQSASLLAVIAGYGVLLLFNQGLAGLRRQAAHRQLVEQLTAALQARVLSAAAFSSWQAEVLLPGLELQRLQLRSVGESSPAALDGLQLVDGAASLEWRDQRAWLVSRLMVPLADGSRIPLRLSHDVTASVQQEQLAFWWLVVAAGVSVLFTSALLRPVLRRGLVVPLETFGAQLQGFQVPPSPEDVIDVAAQPEELQPIALAFNDLQQRLSASWERQRSFVDGVAHELRTPITLISGHAQSLLRYPSREPDLTTLALIGEEADRMGSLVSDLLDLARRDSGRLLLKCQPIVGDDALLALYERMAPKASGRLRLQLQEGDLPDPPLGLGDPDRLQQCLTTLVDNALLYSPSPASVTLAISTGPAGELVLHVRDRGPGVAADERELIFERFMRGSAGLRSPVRGSGIGLSVVKLLIEAMGGRVQVQDRAGGGADFQLLLPPFKV